MRLLWDREGARCVMRVPVLVLTGAEKLKAAQALLGRIVMARRPLGLLDVSKEAYDGVQRARGEGGVVGAHVRRRRARGAGGGADDDNKGHADRNLEGHARRGLSPEVVSRLRRSL